MNRLKFLKLLSLGIIGISTKIPFQYTHGLFGNTLNRATKNWAWLKPNLDISDSDWRKRFSAMRDSGINAILPEIFNSRYAFYASRHLPVRAEWLERILPIAKKEGLEVHAWMWSMPCNIPEIYEDNPEWYVVNGNGESSVIKPAYVPYYKFLCPSRKEVQEFIQERIVELSAYDELDGIHLDYIRLPDVIIAEALQPRYNVVQDREYPEFDYCYCEVCRAKFRNLAGRDPLESDDPSRDDAWRQFRYDSVTNLVNDKLIPIGRRRGKIMTAAVFPNWEAVRQQWMAWNLDAFMPMLYHNFYNGDIEWIRYHTGKGVNSLDDRVPLYSGLFIPQLDEHELSRAVTASLEAGAAGISIFDAGAMHEKHWRVLNDIVNPVLVE